MSRAIGIFPKMIVTQIIKLSGMSNPGGFELTLSAKTYLLNDLQKG